MPHLLSANLPLWLGEVKVKNLKTPCLWAVFTEICLTYWGQKLPHWLGEAKLKLENSLCSSRFHGNMPHLLCAKSSPTDWAKQNSKLENSLCLSSFHENMPHLLSATPHWTRSTRDYWKKDWWKLPLFEPFSRKYASLIERKSSPTDWAKQNSKIENSLCLCSFHGNMPHLLSASTPLIRRNLNSLFEQFSQPHLLCAKLIGRSKTQNLKRAVFTEICLTYWTQNPVKSHIC